MNWLVVLIVVGLVFGFRRMFKAIAGVFVATVLLWIVLLFAMAFSVSANAVL